MKRGLKVDSLYLLESLLDLILSMKRGLKVVVNSHAPYVVRHHAVSMKRGLKVVGALSWDRWEFYGLNEKRIERLGTVRKTKFGRVTQ